MFATSRFNELLQALPNKVFYDAVSHHRSDRYAKTLKSWDILILMIYGQLQQVNSLRTLVTGFNQHQAYHYHLNTSTIHRSTLSDALAKRSPEPFKAVCEALLSLVSRQQRKSAQDILCAIDSTVITLRGPRYDDWSLENKTRITQGLKVHIGMDIQQQAPVYANITYTNVNDLSDAREMPIQPAMTYIMDKAYCDYNWWHRINESDAWFITRMKDNARYDVMEQFKPDPDKECTIETDERIHLTRKHQGKGQINAYANKDLRRIMVTREDKDTPLVLVTNDFNRSAVEIAGLYRQRWQIELLFKWLKQQLKVKTTFGNSENAVRIQLYSALITYLLITLFKQSKDLLESMNDVLISLKESLFSRPTLGRYYYQRRKEREHEISKRQIGLWC